MVTTSHDIEFFNNAYENICLIADKTWTLNPDNYYQRLNQRLWIQKVKWAEEVQKRSLRVRDVIPESRLACYGNYEYDENLERQYEPIKTSPDQIGRLNIQASNKTSEPWMRNDVEEFFIQLTSYHKTPLIHEKLNYVVFNSGELNDITTDDNDYQKYGPLPYSITTNAELKLHISISHDAISNLWTTGTSSSNDRKCSRQSLNDNGYKQRCKPEEINYVQHPVVSRRQKGFRESKGKSTLPLLSAEVPEFFPKGPAETRYDSVPLQYFPSIDRYYQEKHVFAFNRPSPHPNVTTIFQNPGIPLVVPPLMTPLIRSHHQWIPRTLGPPLQIQIPMCLTSLQSICPVIHRPIQLHEKVIQPNQYIPVYQRPPELYQDNRRKSQGVDFNNLILLTKNAMKARRNQSKNPQQSSSFILESKQPNLKSEEDVLQWLNKGYSKRAKEFIEINSLVTDLRRIESDSIDAKSS